MRILGIVGVAGWVCACGRADPPLDARAAVTEAPRLERAASCNVLREAVARGWTERLVRAYLGGGVWTEDVGVVDKGDAFGAEPGAATHSVTNVQVEGVDEPDTVETDGRFLYVLGVDGGLDVVDAWPAATASRVERVALGGLPRGLLLEGDVLAVVGDSTASWARGLNFGGYRHPGVAARVELFDVATPTAVVGRTTLEVEGSLVEARRVDGVVTLALAWDLPQPTGLWRALEDLPTPDLGDASARTGARALARQRLLPMARRAAEGLPDEALVPHVRQGAVTEPAMTCADVLVSPHPDDASFLVMLDVDMHRPGDRVRAQALQARPSAIWMGADTLLVAEATGAAIGDADLPGRTRIHALTRARGPVVGPGGRLRERGVVTVEGTVLDRWSLDRFGDTVRVVTTELRGWGIPWEETRPLAPANRLAVLGLGGAEGLVLLGELTGITPGETLTAARFFGDRAFLVTFEQVDPLLAVDLSDPKHPRLAGELQVPGFATYLHPYGEDQLLAVGMDGTRDGAITGVAVSLYDVADLSAPVQLDRLGYLTGWSASPALWDPHAFLLTDDVLALPIYLWDERAGVGFSGLSVVQVDPRGSLTELGRVDHAGLGEERCLEGLDLDGGVVTEGEVTTDGRVSCASPWVEMRRALTLEDVLYAVSDVAVTAHPLHDPATVLAEVPIGKSRWTRASR